MPNSDEIAVRRLLLVEDNPDHAMLAARALRGYFRDVEVKIASTAEEGERLFAKGDWDAVVVDYSLPRGNGLQVIQKMSAMGTQAPLLMLTGNGDERVAVAALKGGAADYVTKSGDYLTLLPTAVESAIRHARVASDRTRLASELEQANRHLSAVNAVAVAVSCWLHLDEMLEEAVKQVSAIVGAPAAVLLPEENGRRLLLAAYSGLSQQTLESLAGKILPPGNDEALERAVERGYASLDLLGEECRLFALAADGEPQGVLAVFLKPDTPPGPGELETLSTLARVIGMGVRNGRLFEETRALSLQDELTTLSNRRLFNIKLQSDFAAVRRYGTRLALLLLDVDHFKDINDRYGHQVGDAVLRRLGELLLERSRSADLTFRYGGEEFTVLLPHTEARAAIRVAERIRSVVEAETFQVGDLSIRLTVSLGVAWYREGMQTEEDLVAEADRALYLAKQNGRNRVCTANDLPLPVAEARPA